MSAAQIQFKVCFLGQIHYANVFEAQDKKDGHLVAVKVLSSMGRIHEIGELHLVATRFL